MIQETPVTAPDASSKLTPKRNTLLLIIVSLVIVLLILVTSIFGYLYFQSKSAANSTNIQSSSASSSDISGSSSSTESNIAFSFPIFTDLNQSSLKSLTNSSTTAENSQAGVYNITLKPKFTDGLTQQILSESKCSENIYTTNGLVKYQSDTKSMLISHARLVNRPMAKTNLQQAKNYVSRSTDFMSDGNTGFGPDYLQFLRPTCNQMNITKVREITDASLKYNDAVRGLYTLQGNNNFPDVVINIYSQKDDHLILLSKSYKFDDFFSRAQYQSCSDNSGVPKLFCLSDLINNNNEMQTKLSGGVKELLASFEI